MTNLFNPSFMIFIKLFTWTHSPRKCRQMLCSRLPKLRQQPAKVRLHIQLFWYKRKVIFSHVIIVSCIIILGLQLHYGRYWKGKKRDKTGRLLQTPLLPVLYPFEKNALQAYKAGDCSTNVKQPHAYGLVGVPAPDLSSPIHFWSSGENVLAPYSS